MSEDCEKLINLSLCKIAESRTVRRGAPSLHKHLLISTVLTKARSAYFETWYMGDGEVTEASTGRTVDLNCSYQELDFPLDEDDEEDEDEIDGHEEAAAIAYYEDLPSSSTSQERAAEERNDDNFDPRFFVEVGTDSESEIELPSDILNCVEKMGDISDMSFTLEDSSASTPPTSPNAMDDSNQKDLSADEENNLEEESSPQLTYLDLDSPTLCTTTKEFFKDSEENNNNNDDKSSRLILNDDNEPIAFGAPSFTSTPNKRPRSWDYEEEPSSDDDDDEEGATKLSCQFRLPDGFVISGAIKSKSRSITKISKRLRFSPEAEDSQEKGSNNVACGEDKSAKSKSKPIKPVPVIVEDREFRIKKSHFDEEDDEPEDPEDDDPFLGDSLCQSPPRGSLLPQQLPPRRKNDQRVPSASSGSSSDEDADQGEDDNSMEVDQITNLVHFISFQPKLISSSSSVSSTSGPATNHWPTVYS